MNIYPFGQCTWWCADQQPWCMRSGNLGDALDWAANWRSHGGYVTMTPGLGDIACFQPGADGADAVFGHVAVVVKLEAAGFFMVSEMNGPAGPGHTDDRLCLNGPGVSFLSESTPMPPIPQEEETMIICDVNAEIGSYLLTGGGYVGIYNGTDREAFLSAGAKACTITPQQHERFIAAFATTKAPA
jgi:surface antigen